MTFSSGGYLAPYATVVSELHDTKEKLWTDDVGDKILSRVENELHDTEYIKCCQEFEKLSEEFTNDIRELNEMANDSDDFSYGGSGFGQNEREY